MENRIEKHFTKLSECVGGPGVKLKKSRLKKKKMKQLLTTEENEDTVLEINIIKIGTSCWCSG